MSAPVTNLSSLPGRLLKHEVSAVSLGSIAGDQLQLVAGCWGVSETQLHSRNACPASVPALANVPLLWSSCPQPVPTTAHHEPWSPHTHRQSHHLSQQGHKANTRLRKLVWPQSGHLSNTSHDCTSTGVVENMGFRMTGGRWCWQLFWL